MSRNIPDELFPRSFSSIISYPVNDETVLHDPREEQMLALNAPGRAVWELSDGTRSVREIAHQLGESFDAPVETLLGDIKPILSEWLDRNLIELSKTRFLSEDRTNHELIRVAFEASQVHIHTDQKQVSEYLRRRFQAMLTSEEGRVVGEIGVSKIGDNYSVSGCERLTAPERSIAEVLRTVKHEIDRNLVEANPNLIWLHAGGVAAPSGAVVMGGNFGAGKSTVISHLYDSGWDYLSDDIIPLDPLSGSAYPFPLTPMYRVNDGEWVPESKVSNLKRIWVEVDQERISPAPVPISGFVFPQYDPDAETALLPLESGAAVVELVQHCMNFKHHGGAALRGLAALIGGKRVFRLPYNDGVHAASLVADEFES